MAKQEALRVSKNIFEAKHHPKRITNHELKTMTEEDLFKLYDNLIEIENKRYPGRNTAKHKLVFLVGDLTHTNDVTAAQDEHGQPIYTDVPDHPKAPEITEAVAAISSYFEGNMGVPRILSEVADVFHNLIVLTKLDSNYEKAYKNECINLLADSLGFSVKDAYSLAFIKYQSRLIDPGHKDIKHEDTLIKNAITKDSLLPYPTRGQIGDTYRTLNFIGNKIIMGRQQLIEDLGKFKFKNGNSLKRQ